VSWRRRPHIHQCFKHNLDGKRFQTYVATFVYTFAGCALNSRMQNTNQPWTTWTKAMNINSAEQSNARDSECSCQVGWSRGIHELSRHAGQHGDPHLQRQLCASSDGLVAAHRADLT